MDYSDDVIAIHSRIVKKSGGLDGLRDRDILESAIYYLRIAPILWRKDK